MVCMCLVEAASELTSSWTGWGMAILDEMHGNITQSHHNVALAGFMIHSAMGILQVLFVHFHCKCACQAKILAQHPKNYGTSMLSWSARNTNNLVVLYAIITGSAMINCPWVFTCYMLKIWSDGFLKKYRKLYIP